MAHEIYLHLDSIVGECNETYHKHWIVLESFNCSITSAYSDGDMSGACEHGEVSILLYLTKQPFIYAIKMQQGK